MIGLYKLFFNHIPLHLLIFFVNSTQPLLSASHKNRQSAKYRVLLLTFLWRLDRRMFVTLV